MPFKFEKNLVYLFSLVNWTGFLIPISNFLAPHLTFILILILSSFFLLGCQSQPPLTLLENYYKARGVNPSKTYLFSDSFQGNPLVGGEFFDQKDLPKVEILKVNHGIPESINFFPGSVFAHLQRGETVFIILEHSSSLFRDLLLFSPQEEHKSGLKKEFLKNLRFNRIKMESGEDLWLEFESGTLFPAFPIELQRKVGPNGLMGEVQFIEPSGAPGALNLLHFLLEEKSISQFEQVKVKMISKFPELKTSRFKEYHQKFSLSPIEDK